MTATDANRMALKVARSFTGRQLILCFNGTYHGSVDETLVVNFFGELINVPGMLGPIVPDAKAMTRVVDFNDIPALEQALAPGDVACVITEPVMTNVGIIFPEPGFHEALRDLTRKHGTLLLIDETHSMCAGPRGITGEMGLTPDIFVAGKFIAGGYPAAVLGFSEEITGFMNRRTPWHNFFGFGGTLSGNATAVAGIRAALEHAINEENYARMVRLAKRMEDGLARIITEAGLAWYVVRIGCRVEFRFLPRPPKNGLRGAVRRAGLQRGGHRERGAHRTARRPDPRVVRQPGHPAHPGPRDGTGGAHGHGAGRGPLRGRHFGAGAGAGEVGVPEEKIAGQNTATPPGGAPRLPGPV
jgi:glutamate-1-semialdehyde 2,1-aminomutase